MTKVKSNGEARKTSLKGVKDPPIGKKKAPKFKQTPTGKVPLINGSNTPKATRKNDSQKSQKKESQKSVKRSSPHSKENVSKNENKVNESASSEQKKKKRLKEEDESDEDINEGIDTSMLDIKSDEDSKVSSDDDDTSDDLDVPNLLGTSLADDTDEDDLDFEEDEGDYNDDDDEDEDEDEDEDGDEDDEVDSAEDEEEEEEEKEIKKKGVKMFKGLERTEDKEEDDSDDDDDDDSDESEDSEDDSLNISSLIDRNEDEDDDDDDDDEDEDDDDSDDDDDDDSDDVESGLGLKDLLGNSIVDDDSDEDFEAEDEDDEDTDISDEEEDEKIIQRSLEKKVNDREEDDDDDEEEVEAEEEDTEKKVESEEPKRIIAKDSEEKDKRTIFVGNVPKETIKSEIKKTFNKFGPIESMRIRGIVPEDPNMSQKVAAIKKKIHANIDTVNVYVVYKSEESAVKALSLNGKKFKGNFLRVDRVWKDPSAKQDQKKSIFLGNLAFDVKVDDVWDHFTDCGEIDSIRIVRDAKTGLSKGIGYVNFKTEDSVTLALELNGTKIGNRQVRIKSCATEGGKRKSKQRKRAAAKSHLSNSPKKIKTDNAKAVATNGSPQEKSKKKQSQGDRQRQKQIKDESKGAKKEVPAGSPPKEATSFQGQKAEGKKKKKFNRAEKRKKIMAAKLTATSRKTQNS